MLERRFFLGLPLGFALVVLLYLGGNKLYQLSRGHLATHGLVTVRSLPPATTSGQSAPEQLIQNPPTEAAVEPISPRGAPDTTRASPSAEPPARKRQPADRLTRTVSEPLVGRFPVIELAEDVVGSDLDAHLAQLAVAGPFGQSVGIYDVSDLTEPPQLIAFDGPITSVTYKPLDERRWLIVGLDLPPRLALVDASTLAVSNSIRLQTSPPRQLVASLNPADPHLVYLTGPDLKGPRVFDLRQLKETSSLGTGLVDALLSVDGQYLFYRSHSQSRAVGLCVDRRKSGSDPRTSFDFERIGIKLGSILPMYVGFNDRVVAAGKHLFSHDLQKEFATVSFEPQAFLAKSPWMAGFNRESERFCIGSMNDYRTVQNFDLPKGWLHSPRAARPIGHRPRELRWQTTVEAAVLADEPRQQFLLITPRHLVAIPIAKLGLPDEKLLWLSSALPKSATIGELYSVQLDYSGKPDSISLGKHPDGMVLAGAALQWTPQEAHFGNHEIEIVAKSGEVERIERLSLGVSRPSIKVPFSDPGGIELSDDGQRALIWGERVDGTQEHREFMQLCLADLSSKTVVATRSMQQPFSAAFLHDETVYLLRRGEIEPFSAETLEPQTNGTTIRGGQPILTIFQKGERPWRFDLNTLNRLEEGDASEVPDSDDEFAGPTSFGWVSEGVLWNELTGQPKLLMWPAAFRTTSWRDALLSSPHSAGEIVLSANTWHPCSHNAFEPRASSVRDKILYTTISPHVPAFLAITQDNDTFYLSALSLIGRREIEKIPLARKEAEPIREVAIKTTMNSFMVLLQGRLYCGSLDLLRKSVQAPLHIVPQQNGVTLRPDQPTKIRYVSQDAERFHLESRDISTNDEWYHQESTTGEFTLSVPEILDKLVESHAEQIANQPAVLNADNGTRLQYYLKRARIGFLHMLGRLPEGVPIPLRVFVTAEGASLQRASIAHDFLVEVPRQLVERALDKKYPFGRDPWKKPDTVSFDPAMDEYPHTLSPPTGSDPLAVYMRREWSAERQPIPSLVDAANAAKSTGDERLRKSYLEHLAKQGRRIWTDQDGNRIAAVFVSQFAGQVVLKMGNNREVILEVDNLSAGDRQFLAELDNQTTPRDAAPWRTFLMQHAARAVMAFEQAEGFLPPRAMMDAAAKPTLSWRVLLLPQLGYQELYSLFRIREPWNSEHNLVLLKAMPDCFALDLEQAPRHETALQTVAGRTPVLSTETAHSSRGIVDGASATVVFAEVASDRAKAWTQPVDLFLYDLASPTAVFRVRDQAIHIALLNGLAQTIPAGAGRDVWREAVEDGDRKPIPDKLRSE